MQTLMQLAEKTDEKTHTAILLQTWYFPILAEKPLVSISYDVFPDWSFLYEKLEHCNEIAAVDETRFVLKLLQRNFETSHLEQFDSMNILHGELFLLSIVHKNRKINRCVCVDIHTYRKKMMSFLKIRQKPWSLFLN